VNRVSALDPDTSQRLASVGEEQHVARLRVRGGMLHRAEVVAGRVVDAVEVRPHGSTVTWTQSDTDVGPVLACPSELRLTRSGMRMPS
jgi:hypothetical protein